jgi:hypothetical protein
VLAPGLESLNDAGAGLRTTVAFVILLLALALGRWFMRKTLVQDDGPS